MIFGTEVPYFLTRPTFSLQPFDTSQKRDWHDWDAMKRDAEREGPGEHGRKVTDLTPETKRLNDQLYGSNGFSAAVSDLIAIDRSVKDIRHPG